MYTKVTSALAAVLLGGSSVYAGIPDNFAEQIQPQVARAVAQVAPLNAYRNALENMQEPSYQEFRPLFENLTVYNTAFAKETVPAKKETLAKTLNQPVKVGWNSYRTVDMLEIFRSYFPQENRDENIALLEYNVKSNLLSPLQRAEIAMLQNTQQPELVQFYNSYEQFAQTLQRTSSYNPKELAAAFVTLIKNCNEAKQALPEVMVMAKNSLFRKAILAGWGRTTSVEEIRRQLGTQIEAGGDGVNLYSSKKLQEMYGLSAQDAELMAVFVKEYYMDK